MKDNTTIMGVWGFFRSLHKISSISSLQKIAKFHNPAATFKVKKEDNGYRIDCEIETTIRKVTTPASIWIKDFDPKAECDISLKEIVNNKRKTDVLLLGLLLGMGFLTDDKKKQKLINLAD